MRPSSGMRTNSSGHSILRVGGCTTATPRTLTLSRATMVEGQDACHGMYRVGLVPTTHDLRQETTCISTQRGRFLKPHTSLRTRRSRPVLPHQAHGGKVRLPPFSPATETNTTRIATLPTCRHLCFLLSSRPWKRRSVVQSGSGWLATCWTCRTHLR